MEKSNAQVTKETLRWVHIAISNAKRKKNFPWCIP